MDKLYTFHSAKLVSFYYDLIRFSGAIFQVFAAIILIPQSNNIVIFIYIVNIENIH